MPDSVALLLGAGLVFALLVVVLRHRRLSRGKAQRAGASGDGGSNLHVSVSAGKDRRGSDNDTGDGGGGDGGD